MLLTGKCPSCQKTVTRLNIQTLDAGQPMVTSWVGVVYLCPSCNTVLGAGIDPIALKTDTINGVIKKLKGKV